ncbi:MAG: hypothetical protein LQ352_006469 [Teloschistes flavicans]|nr:MAG: hypothetical protein LQ352_006469 [Teloschistes flavicans]
MPPDSYLNPTLDEEAQRSCNAHTSKVLSKVRNLSSPSLIISASDESAQPKGPRRSNSISKRTQKNSLSSSRYLTAAGSMPKDPQRLGWSDPYFFWLDPLRGLSSTEEETNENKQPATSLGDLLSEYEHLWLSVEVLGTPQVGQVQVGEDETLKVSELVPSQLMQEASKVLELEQEKILEPAWEDSEPGRVQGGESASEDSTAGLVEDARAKMRVAFVLNEEHV